MNRQHVFSFMIFSLLFTSCCPITSINPLSPPEEAPYDKQLEGTWFQKDENGKIGYLHIGKDNGNIAKVLITEFSQSGTLEYSAFLIFPTYIDNKKYLNINTKELNGKSIQEKEEYIFIRYELSDDDALSLYYMDENMMAKGIQSGRLRGEISYRKPFIPADKIQQSQKEILAHVRITDESKNIIDFLKDSDTNELFPKRVELKRLKIE